jgi:hypothetical protein
MGRSREERETIIRFDETSADAYLWTASPREARRWRERGYVLKTEPGGWSTRAPKKAIRPLRRVVGGQIVKRSSPARSAALEGIRAKRSKSANQPPHPSTEIATDGTAITSSQRADDERANVGHDE